MFISFESESFETYKMLNEINKTAGKLLFMVINFNYNQKENSRPLFGWYYRTLIAILQLQTLYETSS